MSLRNLYVLTIIYFSIAAVATPSRASDQLILNGTAVHTSLQQDYYYAALFSDSPSDDAQTLLWQDSQRMEMTILVEEWSKRRFTQHLGQAIAINNTADNQEHNAKDMVTFNTLIKGYLIRGDRVVIDKNIDKGTTISINGITLMQTDSHDFFTLFLNTWIGNRPPSTTFKDSILGKTPSIDSSMMASYESLNASTQRIEDIKSWYKKDKPKRKAVAKNTTKSIKITAKEIPKKSLAASNAKVESAIIETQPRYMNTTERIETEDIDLPITAESIAFEFGDSTSTRIKSLKKSANLLAANTPVSNEKESMPLTGQSTNKSINSLAGTESTKIAEKKKDLLKFYRSKILATTYKKIVYPSKAIDKNQQGKVIIKVTINRDGKVQSVVLKEKSKFKLLNQAANKAVAKAHYPNVPAELEGNEFEFLLPIQFSLN